MVFEEERPGTVIVLVLVAPVASYKKVVYGVNNLAGIVNTRSSLIAIITRCRAFYLHKRKLFDDQVFTTVLFLNSCCPASRGVSKWRSEQLY